MVKHFVSCWTGTKLFTRFSELQRDPLHLMRLLRINFSAMLARAAFALILGVGSILGSAKADTLELDGTRAVIDLSSYLSLYQTQNTRSGDRRLRPVDEQKTVDAEVWQGLKILNATSTSMEKVFVLRHPAVTGSGVLGTMGAIPKILEVVVVDSGKPLIAETSFVRAEDQHFSLVIPPGQEIVLGMRLDTPPRSGMAALWSPSAFENYNRSSLIVHNMLIGALLIMALLLLALGVYSGVSPCLWAGLVALSTAFYFAAYFGYIANNVTLLGFLDITLAHVYLTLAVIFALEYLLKVSNFGPSQGFQEKAVEATQYAAVFVLIIVLLGVPETGSVVRIFVLLGAILSVAVLSLQMASDQPAARLVLPGAAVILIGCLTIIGLSFAGDAAFLIPLEPLAYVIFTAGIALVSFASFLLIEQDVSEQEITSQPLQQAPETFVASHPIEDLPAQDGRYEVAMMAAGQGLWDLNIDAGRLTLSGNIMEQLGLDEASGQMSLADWLGRIHPNDREVFQDELEAVQSGDSVVLNSAFRVLSAEGDYLHMELRASRHSGNDGDGLRCLGIIAETEPDMTSEWPILGQVAPEGPDVDGLTGLPGIAEFLSDVAEALLSFKRHGPPPEGIARPVILAIDIDRFRTFNEGLGTDVADQLLVTLSGRLHETKSSEDVLTRVSGHEFALLTRLTGHETNVDDLVQRLQSAISRPLELGEQKVFPTVSVGVAICHDTDQSAESLLTEAQQALYEAQKSGQSSTVTYEPGMGVDRSQELAFETELRRALENYEMEVFYQPIMDLKDGRIAGFESLIRWNHPTQGLLSPAQFVPRAEELGLIKPLGRFALSMTSLQLSQWQQFFDLEKPLFASVNISTKQLLDDDLVKDFSEIMRSVELAPDSLKLEVTESQLEGNEDEAAELLSGLRRLGGGVVLDDFGTGHSSLERLRRFPFDTIKIDQSFVRELFENDQSKVMVKSAIDLAHNLDMDIVAEGVETEEVGRELLEMGCNYAQGYIFGAPMTAMEAQAFIANYWSK